VFRLADTPMNAPTPNSSAASTDIHIVALFTTLWSAKYRIILATGIFSALGVAVALLSPEEYYSEAIIAPKDNRNARGVGGVLSQFGGLGGLVGGDIGGGITLTRLEILAKGREVSEEVITEYELLPQLFLDDWNSKEGKWLPGSEVPSVNMGVDALRNGCLRVISEPKNGILRVGITFGDSTWAKKIVDAYLERLNDRIRRDVIEDSKKNQAFLGDQLNTTLDPRIREKIQNLLGVEIEKSMLVSNSAFDVIERAVVPDRRSAPNRKLILLASTVSGFLLACLGALVGRQLKNFGIIKN
jgi:Chain length determinant protein